MEHLVMEQLEEILKHYNCCKCDKCKKDMYAYALNQLPAKYVTSVEGEAFTKLEMLTPTSRVKLIAIITKTIEDISKNKRCVHENILTKN